jgi:hypothetical protein
MQACNAIISDFLGAKKAYFVVPVYQRNYDWLDGNCRQLFFDIEKIIETGEEHFIGTVVFKASSAHERALIDGQQRLSSCTLLLKALRDETDNEDLKQEIDETYIYNAGRNVTDSNRVKLRLNRRDDVVYRLILENPPNKLEEILTDRQKESRVYRNYLLFSDLIRKYSAAGNDTGRIFDAMEKLTFIELEIQNENAQEVFESLNSTGLSLTNVDLLRNYLLMQYDYGQQTYLYDKYWSEIENNVGPAEMENFFVDYLICRRKGDSAVVAGRNAHINRRTLYAVFRDYYRNECRKAGTDEYDAIERIFADMLACSEEYRKLIFADDVNPFLLSAADRKLYEISVLNAPSMKSLLLYLLMRCHGGKISSSVFDGCILAVASFAMRSKICGGSASSQFAGSVIMRVDAAGENDDFQDVLWKALFSGKGKYAFPSDEAFAKAVCEAPMYQALRSRGTKYFLYELESHSPFPKGLPAYDDAAISIEHVMPQTLSNTWEESLSAADRAMFDVRVHCVGNLAIVSANSEISNAPFEVKKHFYRETNFYFTRQLCKHGKWDISEIEQRGREMADLALQIWRCPKKYQTHIRFVSGHLAEDEYGLTDDFAMFTFAKPTMISIAGEETPVTGWRQMIGAVCDFLRQTDPDILHAVVRPEKSGLFKYRNNIISSGYDLSLYTEIDHGIYTRAAKSAHDTLVTVARILENYDREAETTFYDSFRFRIRKRG